MKSLELHMCAGVLAPSTAACLMLERIVLFRVRDQQR
jgi:hypothetical protein